MGRPTNAEIEARKAAGEPEPEPLAGNDLLAQVLNRLVDMQENAKGEGITAGQLETILASNAESTRKALKPENARHPDVSAFNPKGERDFPRPDLRRKTFWIGVPLIKDELTFEEIELFNGIEHNMTARGGQWTAELKNAGTELHINFPNATMDERMDLPSMRVLMHELIGGDKAVSTDDLLTRVAELEKRLAGVA